MTEMLHGRLFGIRPAKAGLAAVTEFFIVIAITKNAALLAVGNERDVVN